MRFVKTKTAEQQSCLMMHRTRHVFIRQQTAVINAIRAHLAEFGIVAPIAERRYTRISRRSEANRTHRRFRRIDANDAAASCSPLRTA